MYVYTGYCSNILDNCTRFCRGRHDTQWQRYMYTVKLTDRVAHAPLYQ